MGYHMHRLTSQHFAAISLKPYSLVVCLLLTFVSFVCFFCAAVLDQNSNVL